MNLLHWVTFIGMGVPEHSKLYMGGGGWVNTKGAFDWADLEQDCSKQRRSIGLIWFSSAWCMHQLLRLRRLSGRSSLTFCPTFPSNWVLSWFARARKQSLMRFAIRCDDHDDTSPEICVDLGDIKQIEQFMVEAFDWSVSAPLALTAHSCSGLAQLNAP